MVDGASCQAATCMASINGVTAATVYFQAIITSSDGGLTWQTAGPIPPNTVFPAAVACSTATTCAVAAVGPANNPGPMILATTDGGAIWTPSLLPGSPTTDPPAVACFATACIASDQTTLGDSIIDAGTL
jgi:hypothetical protein